MRNKSGETKPKGNNGDGNKGKSKVEIKIIYANVWGLRKEKFDVVQQYLRDGETDIFIVAEHWYLKDEWPKQITDPTFVCTTPQASVRTVGRQNYGMAIFAHPSLHNSIHIVDITAYSIAFTVGNVNYLSVYLPSDNFDPIDCRHIFELGAKAFEPTYILGDMNMRLGSLSYDEPKQRHTTKERNDNLFEWTEQRQYRFCRPTNQKCSRTEHLFYRRIPPKRWSADKIPFRSDHSVMMTGVFPTEVPVDLSDASEETLRMFLKYLDNEEMVKDLLSVYDMDLMNLGDLIEGLRTNGNDVERDEVVKMVDEIGVALARWVDYCGEKILGKYCVQKEKRRKDKMTEAIGEDTSPTAAIRIWKRSKRGYTKPIVSDVKDKSAADAVKDYYLGVFTPSESNPEPLRQPPPPPEFDSAQDLSAAYYVSYKEGIKKQIHKYPSDKSVGPDGLHIRLLKALTDSEVFMDHLSSFFFLCVKYGTTPACWNIANVTLLPKTDAECVKPSETRPIAGTQIFRRIFEKRLMDSWTSNHPDWTKLHPTQAGFRTGRSAPTQALFASDAAARGLMLAAYLDFKSAYDKVPHRRILDRLREVNAPEWVVSIVYSLMCRHISASYIVNGKRTSPIRLAQGLFQGSILSPFLFNIFIDTLLQAIAAFPNHTGIPYGCAYADDVKLGIAIKKQCEITALRLLNTCSTWGDANGMLFNLVKSQTVGWPYPDNLAILQRGRMPNVKSYKHLGFPASVTGIDWGAHAANLGEKAGGTLQAMMISGRTWSHMVKLTNYKTFVRPQMEYGLGMMYGCIMMKRGKKEWLTGLQQVHNDALEWIFGGVSKRTRKVLEGLTGLGSFEDRCKELQDNFTFQLERTPPDDPVRLHRGQVGCLTSFMFQHSQRRKDYERKIATLPIDEKLEFKTWSRNRKLEGLTWSTKNKQGSKMLNYVTAGAWTDGSKVDKCLGWKDKELRRKAILWRTNQVFMKRRCPCGDMFSRSHLVSCVEFFAGFESVQEEAARRRRHWLQDPQRQRTHYNALDEALNSDAPDLFQKLFDELDSTLEHGKPKPKTNATSSQQPSRASPSPSPSSRASSLSSRASSRSSRAPSPPSHALSPSLRPAPTMSESVPDITPSPSTPSLPAAPLSPTTSRQHSQPSRPPDPPPMPIVALPEDQDSDPPLARSSPERKISMTRKAFNKLFRLPPEPP